MFRKILIPVDLTEPDFAESAIDKLFDLTAPQGAEAAQIRLMTVRQVVPEMGGEYLPVDFDAGAAKESESALRAFAAKLALPTAQVSVVVRIGSVQHEVLEEAREFGADLIAVGSHQPTIATYLLGSNATDIVRHATCSVLVIR